ncbi:MAG TPA: alpha-L-fucosidase, partial [Luteolibacter sp.]|nr:alpha-L-fucosidase [Luteolibacter sp.]
MKRKVLGAGLLSVLVAGWILAASDTPPATATAGDPYANETQAQRDARMAWWREAKFGMFIHWGVYSVVAGEHEGVRDGEWIMRRAEIPVKRYREYAKGFTADHYDPKAWADLAAKAGMRYVVITAKHHDGFALYPSEVSDWNVVKATPCGKDVIAPLAQAVRAKGMHFGLYYSHSQDWLHPGGAKWRYDEYLKTIAVPQVREILTRYQPDVLWWDTPHYMTAERGEPLIRLLPLRPGIIHNDRLGGGYPGDTETPENFIPPMGFPGRDWETCMTMNDNWGYVRDDHDWKSAPTIIRNLVDIVSKGGNYLLNVGPDASGRIPQESIERLTAVGRWMQANGEAIYGTQASPFACRLPWGRCTTKPDGADTILYLHVLDEPVNGVLQLPGLKNEVLSAGMLGSKLKPVVANSSHGLRVSLPFQTGERDLGLGTTLVLRLKGKPVVERVPVLADPDGALRLTPMDAQLNGSQKPAQSFGVDYITHWEQSGDTVSWKMTAPSTRRYLLRLTGAASDEGHAMVIEGTAKLACKIPKTANMKREFATVDVGEMKMEAGKVYQIVLKPVADG